jgi:hypothetical protein
MTKDEAQKIGKQIWQNEASGREDLLVYWSEREEFPSLGIGHAIWFPQGLRAPYSQQFPSLCLYLEKHGVTLPKWLKKALKSGAPWRTRTEFMQDMVKPAQLRRLLVSTVDLQTQFMIEQLHTSWTQLLKEAPAAKKAAMVRNFNLLQSTVLGHYALVDYFNFKGGGVNAKEVCNGCRWGLLQVLAGMPDKLDEKSACRAFAVSAAKVLVERVEGAAPAYTHLEALPGWIKRVSTYADQKLFAA